MTEDVDLSALRREFTQRTLDENQVSAHPLTQFNQWLDEALQCRILDFNAMTLATCGENGQPSARIVLLKEVDQRGIIFFTNYESRKGQELANNPRAAIVFYWKELERQVRMEGVVEKLSIAENESYFHSRPLESQLSAWASPQSQEIPNRAYLEAKVKQYQEQFARQPLTCPPFWGGFRLIPHYVEFWQGRAHRLHDRIVYRLVSENWQISRLAP
ncbi:MAG: pyridoxamine 5'-phosphate oxidase [Thermoflavifilum sp.]|nr:pyridoxamine 5'-phosphate oxidase [Thermoflavifilum sp.]